MTSVIRYTASQKSLPNPDGLQVLVYSSGGDDLVVPFTFDKRTLTLDFDFNSGFTAGTSINSDTIYVRGQNYGADQLVLGIGPNMISWMETTGNATPGSVQVYELPVVCRVNQLDTNNDPDNVNCTSTSSTPFIFNQSAGTETNKYYATYVFKKPLVLQYINSGSSQVEYRIFTTQWTFQT